MDFLLEGTNDGSGIFLYIILGLLVVFFIYSIFSNNKKRREYLEHIKEIQKGFTVGTKVKTHAGIYGEIISIREALDGSRVVTIKSGEGDNAMTFEIDFEYIVCVDEKDNEIDVRDEEYQELKKKMEETSQEIDNSTPEVEEVDNKEETQENENELDGDIFAKKTKSKKKNKKD